MAIKITVGICETCGHYSEMWDDPGAQDCSLSPGKMLVDAGCAKEMEVAELDNENTGQDENNQCPFWELPASIFYCKHHKEWVEGECGRCMEESFRGI